MVGLHGWGANAQSAAVLAPLLNLPEYELMFPNAPFDNPYTAEGKMWYAFAQDGESRKQSYEQLAQSKRVLTDWLKSLESNTGVPLSRTFLIGFSQGGAMTLDVGLNLPLAGLAVLSGYLHPVAQIESKPPVLIVHGRQDLRVPLSAAHQAKDTLSALGVAVEYEELDMGHEVLPEVLGMVRTFVTKHS